MLQENQKRKSWIANRFEIIQRKKQDDRSNIGSATRLEEAQSHVISSYHHLPRRALAIFAPSYDLHCTALTADNVNLPSRPALGRPPPTRPAQLVGTDRFAKSTDTSSSCDSIISAYYGGSCLDYNRGRSFDAIRISPIVGNVDKTASILASVDTLLAYPHPLPARAMAIFIHLKCILQIAPTHLRLQQHDKRAGLDTHSRSRWNDEAADFACPAKLSRELSSLRGARARFLNHHRLAFVRFYESARIARLHKTPSLATRSRESRFHFSSPRRSPSSPRFLSVTCDSVWRATDLNLRGNFLACPQRVTAARGHRVSHVHPASTTHSPPVLALNTSAAPTPTQLDRDSLICMRRNLAGFRVPAHISLYTPNTRHFGTECIARLELQQRWVYVSRKTHEVKAPMQRVRGLARVECRAWQFLGMFGFQISGPRKRSGNCAEITSLRTISGARKSPGNMAPRSLKKTPENMFTFVFKLAAAAKAAAKKFNKVVTRGSMQAVFATPTQVSVVPSGAPPTYREVYHTHSDDVDSLPSYVEAAHDDVNDYTETRAYESFRTSQREKQYHQDGEETSDRLAQIVSTKRMYTSSPESTRIHISIGVTKRSHGFIQATQRHASSTLTFNRAEIARDWIAWPQRCAPSYAGFRLPDDARLYPRLTDRHPPLPPHTAISPSLQLPPSTLPTPSPLSTPSPLAPNTLVYPDKPASPVLSHKTSARIHSRAPSFSVLVGARSTNARAPSCIAPLVHAQSPDQHTLSSQDRDSHPGVDTTTPHACSACSGARREIWRLLPSIHGEAPEANHLKIRIRFLPLSLPATLPARERRGLHAHRAPRPVASPHPAPTSSGRMSDIRRICWRTNPSDRTANDEADEVGATPQIRDPSFCSLRKQTRSSRARLPARARYICDRKPGAAQKTRRRTAPVAQPEAQVARPVRIAAGPRARTLRHSRASQPLPTLTGRAARRAARAVQVGARRWATTVSVPRGACTVHLVCAARRADLAADLSTHARKSPVCIAAVQPHGHVATMTCVRLAAVSAIRARGGRRAPSQQARSEGAQRAPSGHSAGARRALGGRSA
ncbi:hypothetical protein DFH06DRAFT_1118793 [Mycena polygramma]|nr:hypothetical protein DFH06DRAFT_1118793 [Mycena polygramma]